MWKMLNLFCIGPRYICLQKMSWKTYARICRLVDDWWWGVKAGETRIMGFDDTQTRTSIFLRKQSHFVCLSGHYQFIRVVIFHLVYLQPVCIASINHSSYIKSWQAWFLLQQAFLMTPFAKSRHMSCQMDFFLFYYDFVSILLPHFRFLLIYCLLQCSGVINGGFTNTGRLW